MSDLLQVSLSYATFGIVCHDGHVVDSAPIGKWMIGKSKQYIGDWVNQKGGKVLYIYPEPKGSLNDN